MFISCVYVLIRSYHPEKYVNLFTCYTHTAYPAVKTFHARPREILQLDSSLSNENFSLKEFLL